MLRERLSDEVETERETQVLVIPKPYNNGNICRACGCILICIILPILIYIYIVEIKDILKLFY